MNRSSSPTPAHSAAPITSRTESIIQDQKFWSRVVESGDGCWLWTGGKVRGYGRFWLGSRKVIAHRWSYEALRAEIPEGLHLDHLCRVRACVNPWHLEPVPPAVNNRRAHNLPDGTGHPGYWEGTHCWTGHVLDPANKRLRSVRGGASWWSCFPCEQEASRRHRERRQPVRPGDGHRYHGSTTGYQYGCRCTECRAAHAAYSRALRRAKREAG